MIYFNIYLFIIVCVHCGDGYRSLEKKIIGGSDVTISNYPHAVFLEISLNEGMFICGSSVLNQYYLISVAHCVSNSHEERLNNNMTQVNAFAGHENIYKALAFRRVKRVIIHKKFDPVMKYNDIALLLLTIALPLEENIKRIILRQSFPSDARGTLTGWGCLNELGIGWSITLKSISQTVKPTTRCNVIRVPRGTFCAGSYNEYNPTAAVGDSGGGLVTSKYQLLGLVSFKTSLYPALPVYTNASYYYSWITKITKTALCRS